MRFAVLLFALGLSLATGCQTAPSDAPAADVAEAPPAPPEAPPPPGTYPEPPPAALSEPLGPDGRPEVVLYVTSWCPYCRQARDYMAAEDIPHRVVDIEASQEGAREYAARGGTGGIPLVAVGVETIEGWSEEMARQMLDTAGYD